MLMWLVLGCAVKSGVTVLKMDQQYAEMNTAENRRAQFEWAMAEEYRNKAKEEYASSQFEDAELLAAKSIEWMSKAQESASAETETTKEDTP